MKKFEYKTLVLMCSSELLNSESRLNRLGKEGWELVSVFPNVDSGDTIQGVAFFKREVNE